MAPSGPHRRRERGVEEPPLIEARRHRFEHGAGAARVQTRWRGARRPGIIRAVPRARIVPRLLCGLAALLVAVPATASAQSVIVLVTHAGVPEGAAGLRAAAIEAIAEHGVRLVRTPAGEPCEEDACAAALAAQAGADHTLLLAARSLEEVELRAVPAEGAATVLTQAVVDADFASAIGAAVDRFLAERPPATVGFVMVSTDPPGARVSIDGALAGSSPLRRSVTVGEHTVRVSREGEAARDRTVEVVAGEETAVRFDRDAAAASEDAPAPGPSRTRSEPSPFNWVLGGALAVGGVLALISPLQTLAQDGQCTEEIVNVGCLERVVVGPQTGVLLGVGIAALIAAVIVDAAAPIRVDVEVGTTGAQARVEARF